MKEFKNLNQLQKAVESSVRELATPRKKRVEAIRQYTGSHYSDGGSEKRVPVNFLELAVTIYARQLAARAPRVMITAKDPALRPYAASMELAVNMVPDEIGLADTLRKAVVEAMFSFAIIKVGVCRKDSSAYGVESGETFADLVSLDDYFCDMSAKSRATMQFEGNDYWASLEDVRAMYDGDSEEIQPDKYTIIGEQGETRAESVSKSEIFETYEDKVWLRDVWLVKERKMLTYAVKSQKQIRIVDWKGPKCGPYHVLGFNDVPGNVLPLPPVALWRDLHELGNNLFRKLGRQADAKKTVAAFQAGDTESIDALKNASDGDGIRYNGQMPEAITVGGIDNASLAFFLQVKDLASYFGGNLDALGGLAAQSDTVGQDRLLTEAASSRVKNMAERTIEFAESVFYAIAFYEWTDPTSNRSITKTVPGTDISVPTVWNNSKKKGKFEDYNFEIDVYSMQDDSPGTRLQKLGTALERFVFPIMPVLEASGGQIDVNALVSTVAKLGNIPELTDIVKFSVPKEPEMMPGGANNAPRAEAPGMPNNTTRTYVRQSRPGATKSGKDDVLSRILMGGGVQQSEAARLGRSGS